MSEKEPRIQINELFGPTIQGEGMETGRPCVFIRLHHCPVKCPGCDTAYTWNGTEAGASQTLASVRDWVRNKHDEFPGIGVVLSGGEPLIHYKNHQFTDWLAELASWVSFLGLETSGFVGPKLISEFDGRMSLLYFLSVFSSVHVSPKITPSLHGEGWGDLELLANVPLVLKTASKQGVKTALKFVVRDDEDLRAVVRFVNFNASEIKDIPIYLMPYGITDTEILETSRNLVEPCAHYGFILTPRLHVLMFGNKRGT